MKVILNKLKKSGLRINSIAIIYNIEMIEMIYEIALGAIFIFSTTKLWDLIR